MEGHNKKELGFFYSRRSSFDFLIVTLQHGKKNLKHCTFPAFLALHLRFSLMPEKNLLCSLLFIIYCYLLLSSL